MHGPRRRPRLARRDRVLRHGRASTCPRRCGFAGTVRRDHGGAELRRRPGLRHARPRAAGGEPPPIEPLARRAAQRAAPLVLPARRARGGGLPARRPASWAPRSCSTSRSATSSSTATRSSTASGWPTSSSRTSDELLRLTGAGTIGPAVTAAAAWGTPLVVKRGAAGALVADAGRDHRGRGGRPAGSGPGSDRGGRRLCRRDDRRAAAAGHRSTEAVVAANAAGSEAVARLGAVGEVEVAAIGPGRPDAGPDSSPAEQPPRRRRRQ